jgi:hypothetical protein
MKLTFSRSSPSNIQNDSDEKTKSFLKNSKRVLKLNTNSYIVFATNSAWESMQATLLRNTIFCFIHECTF